MAERISPDSPAEIVESYWSGLYNTPTSPLDIALRRALNFYLAPGVRSIDTDQEAVDVIESVGVGYDEVIIDVGCGFPKFAVKLVRAGHRKVKGIDPNPLQFNGLPHWIPFGPTGLEAVPQRNFGQEINLEQVMTYLGQRGDITPEELAKIILYRTTANRIPADNNSVKAACLLFSGYAIPKAEQPASFAEIRRVVHDELGILILQTSGQKNKTNIREKETEAAAVLSTVLDPADNRPKVDPPIPPNAGLTSENAEEILTEGDDYAQVWVRRHEATMVFDTSRRIVGVLKAVGTLREGYTFPDQPERKLTVPEFHIARRRVFIPWLVDGRATDTLSQTFCVATNQDLTGRLPSDEYVRIK